jgi:AcrR family transcriptional regulator
MTDQSVITYFMAKAAKRAAKKALVRPGNMGAKAGIGGVGGSAGRSGAIAASRQDARAAKTAARRDAILEAALDEFSAKGFASARLDDVAKRAGIAKGTIYLYFADKESLFQELIRAKMVPVVGSLELAFATSLPLRAIVEQAVEIFVREVFGTRRKLVIRLLISEGPRFPAVAEFYYREVLSRLLKALRGMLRNAHERGELTSDALVRFPMLLGAPGIIAIVWSGLFDRFEPLDVRAMMRAYFDNVLGAGSAGRAA